MVHHHSKGERRIALDGVRQIKGEPRANFAKNRDSGCKYGEMKTAPFRNKGRNRFKTGKKTKRSRKVSI